MLAGEVESVMLRNWDLYSVACFDPEGGAPNGGAAPNGAGGGGSPPAPSSQPAARPSGPPRTPQQRQAHAASEGPDLPPTTGRGQPQGEPFTFMEETMAAMEAPDVVEGLDRFYAERGYGVQQPQEQFQQPQYPEPVALPGQQPQQQQPQAFPGAQVPPPEAHPQPEVAPTQEQLYEAQRQQQARL